jgi:hypothetical protein
MLTPPHHDEEMPNATMYKLRIMQEKYYIWQNHIMHIELINLISPVGKKFRRNTPRPCSSNASTQFQRHLEVTERRMLRNRKKKCLTPASAMLQRMQRCRKITEILDFAPGYKISYSLQPFSNRAFKSQPSSGCG